jgi:phage regulator Rha-like protein
MSFDKLENKIETMAQRYEEMKRNNESFETQLQQKEQETLKVKKELTKALKERDMIKQKLGNIISKVDDLGLI